MSQQDRPLSTAELDRPIQNQFARLGMNGSSAERPKRLAAADLEALISDGNVRSAMVSLALVGCLNGEIARLERKVLAHVRLAAQFEPLVSVTGIGKILALTVMLDTGEINRFAKVGHFTSYARCVDAQRFSDDKKKACSCSAQRMPT